MEDHIDLRYGSRYLGKRMANDDSSVKGEWSVLAGAGKGSIDQLLMSFGHHQDSMLE